MAGGGGDHGGSGAENLGQSKYGSGARSWSQIRGRDRDHDRSEVELCGSGGWDQWQW